LAGQPDGGAQQPVTQGSKAWTATTLAKVISPMSTDTALIESVLLAAGLPDAEIAARVADIGPDIVAEAMLA
jgi:hypothetical protein